MGKEPLFAIREREIYARIDRILCHKHIEFALEHQNDSLEQLTEYLKACTANLSPCASAAGRLRLKRSVPAASNPRSHRCVRPNGKSCRSFTGNRIESFAPR